MKILTRHNTPPFVVLAIAALAGTATLPLAATRAADLSDDGSRPVVATERPALPGLGPNSGDALRALLQERPQASLAPLPGYAIHDSFGSVVLAREAPAPAGTGPNSSDLARADLQDDRAAFALLGTRSPARGTAGDVATVDSRNVELHGRGSWNPALVQLHAVPRPLPWETRMARATTPGPAAEPVR